ncbi:hypothetical protein PENNAL_c0004G09592 [Penicillium nalgiovense]|uniref:Uncharacterized protein n=1 Tax=Penicillium nalgiovense TaxID=60175 RepID=A0A1V6Z343_PENNA|nr:hypothetical protein PENNAL_c0004G09592 [Penicillium nalgiovense]
MGESSPPILSSINLIAQSDAILHSLEEHLDRLIKSKEFIFFAFDVLGLLEIFRVPVMGHYTLLHNLTLGYPLLSRNGTQPSSHIFDTCLAVMDARARLRSDMMQCWLDVRAKYPDRMAENEIFAAVMRISGLGLILLVPQLRRLSITYCVIQNIGLDDV